MNEYVCISDDVKLGKDVKLSKFINLYGCIIGDNCKIGAFVEVTKKFHGTVKTVRFLLILLYVRV